MGSQPRHRTSSPRQASPRSSVSRAPSQRSSPAPHNHKQASPRASQCPKSSRSTSAEADGLNAIDTDHHHATDSTRCWGVVGDKCVTTRRVCRLTRDDCKARHQWRSLPSPPTRHYQAGRHPAPFLDAPKRPMSDICWAVHAGNGWGGHGRPILLVSPPPLGKGLHVVINAMLDAPGSCHHLHEARQLSPDAQGTSAHRSCGGVRSQHLAEGLPTGLRWSPVRGDPSAMIRAAASPPAPAFSRWS